MPVIVPAAANAATVSTLEMCASRSVELRDLATAGR